MTQPDTSMSKERPAWFYLLFGLVFFSSMVPMPIVIYAIIVKDHALSTSGSYIGLIGSLATIFMLHLGRRKS